MAVSGPGTPVPESTTGDRRGAPRCVPRDTEQGGPEEAVICQAQGGRPAARAPCQRGHRSSDLTGSTVRQDRTRGAWSPARERERSPGDTWCRPAHSKAVGSASSVSSPSVVKCLRTPK